MKVNNLHPWKVSTKRAKEIQLNLRDRVILKNSLRKIKAIAGCDVSFDKKENRACAAICIYSFPDIKLKQSLFSISKVTFPYVPGLLTFREAPPLIKVLKKIKEKIDIFLFDGQGQAHPLNMGLASHMGLILDLPTIGCAKSRLYGNFNKLPKNKKGVSISLYDKEGKVIGEVLRTKKDVKPIFVSSGHKISLETAKKIILKCCLRYRLPEPIRCAHSLSKKMLKA